jgi:hypothetical protein
LRPGLAGLSEMRVVRGGASRRQKRVVGRFYEKNRSGFQDFAANLTGELLRKRIFKAVTLTTTLPRPRRL